jgi:hypothetical protein
MGGIRSAAGRQIATQERRQQTRANDPWGPSVRQWHLRDRPRKSADGLGRFPRLRSPPGPVVVVTWLLVRRLPAAGVLFPARGVVVRQCRALEQ